MTGPTEPEVPSQPAAVTDHADVSEEEEEASDCKKWIIGIHTTSDVG